MTENKSTIQTAAGVPERERAVLVAVVRDSQELRQSEEYLDELEFLAETADIVTCQTVHAAAAAALGRASTSDRANSKRSPPTARSTPIDVAIFDDELTPSQTRNIERAMPCRILDRTRLILDIFMSRAQTAYAKTQVQLANTNICCPGCRACGRTSNGSAEVRVRAAVPASARSKPTAVSSATGSRKLKEDLQKDRPSDGRAALEPRFRWCVWRWWVIPTWANRR